MCVDSESSDKFFFFKYQASKWHQMALLTLQFHRIQKASIWEIDRTTPENTLKNLLQNFTHQWKKSKICSNKNRINSPGGIYGKKIIWSNNGGTAVLEKSSNFTIYQIKPTAKLKSFHGVVLHKNSYKTGAENVSFFKLITNNEFTISSSWRSVRTNDIFVVVFKLITGLIHES